jgi:hypothetical protein
MSAGDPIKLGSAAATRLVFQKGSKITSSGSGVQSSSIIALCPDGANVFNYLPAAGDSYATVFGNSYLPATFKVDIALGGYDIEYIEGKAARVTINFRRPDPAKSGRAAAKISVDSAINYKSLLDDYQVPFQLAANQDPQTVLGFPEPVVTAKYNTVTPPLIAGGTIGALYAQPSDPRAAGFPALNNISVPLSFFAQKGSTVTYWNNTALVTDTAITVDTFYNFRMGFVPNVLGWKLQKLKWDPVSGQSFYDVQEDWRGQYFIGNPTFVNKGPA